MCNIHVVFGHGDPWLKGKGRKTRKKAMEKVIGFISLYN